MSLSRNLKFRLDCGFGKENTLDFNKCADDSAAASWCKKNETKKEQ
jgi:hypothetical protein